MVGAVFLRTMPPEENADDFGVRCHLSFLGKVTPQIVIPSTKSKEDYTDCSRQGNMNYSQLIQMGAQFLL
ncbi:hypothetical protein TNCV_359151 [Trichonephila clavipes]|nr:hypothetical protein TNCV_359151 [Trichonephila clavipes]